MAKTKFEPAGSLTQTAIPLWGKPTDRVAPHPLMQRNISDFFEQRFGSIFHGDEFFLADHVVKGQRVMPGVAYLEMARAAVDQAMRSTTLAEEHILRLSQVVWIRPLVIDQQPVEVAIALELQEDQKVAFTVSSQTHEAEDEAPAIVSQGIAELLFMEGERTQTLDLAAIRTRCQHFSLSAAECYQRYRELADHRLVILA